MKYTFILFTFLASTLILQADKFETYVGYTAKLYPMSTELTRNQDYLLYIHLPASYDSAPEKRYPVIYSLDPYWDFVSLTNMLGTLEYDQYVPEAIVIGIGYPGANPEYGKLRQIDYTPSLSPYDPNTGDAKAFLSFIEKELIPWTENEYRVDDSFRVLAGSSYGGLFTLYAMFDRPDLFQGLVASTPAVSFDNREIFRKENQFYIGDRKLLFSETAARNLPTRLFMSVGGEEKNSNWIPEANAFADLLKGRRYQDLSFEYVMFDEYKHGGVKFPTYSRGLAYVFEDYMAR
ncbi:alpha/beta hydrolase [Pelagicoccus mobilis]|uniref:Alpha/beta hydrolase n=1 Tax=Pelagicoccus mobilis TaxID=415221 RepID=A0A934VSK1_9BACT|nr:alpha/beta hydrolase-fold protein [Pelagicoccus mobilis]MBK1878753.1 alpha/beta hydrolase [Pelagicoccus mobilis]